MSPTPIAETITAHGCSIVLRLVEGPEVRELFLHCQPPSGLEDPARQAEAAYRAIREILATEGGSWESVVSETIFLRDLPANIGPVRDARGRALAMGTEAPHEPATLEIEQPPLYARAFLEVSVQAVLPGRSTPRFTAVEANAACGCAECTGARGLLVQVGEETRFQAAGLCGPGEDAYQQTLGMFGLAEEMLRRVGMDFGDVVRTWIHLREMDRDYATFNKARREFFESRGIDPVPASTGIGGGPVSPLHDLCLGIYAVKAPRPPVCTVMTSPTLNEAMQYGADFVRGMRVAETNKVALHVSGTASIDERGRSVHCEDFDAQADRMLVNIAALLAGQGAGFRDVVSAITYLKHPADAERLRDRLHRAGFDGLPHAVVVAPICRPELLCETEALAVLPDVNARSRST